MRVAFAFLMAAGIGLTSARALSKTNDEKPWFCHGLECPDYKVVANTSNYEVRRYPAAKWVSTTVNDFKYSSATSTGFMRLFRYISGANAESKKIDMTAPVRVLVHPSQGPFCESSFTISFFVPFAYQNEPPAPESDDVFIEETPETVVYVASYPGGNTEAKLLENARALVEALDKDEVAYSKDHYFFAGYDPPFRLFNRHNEVWVVAADSSAAPQS